MNRYYDEELLYLMRCGNELAEQELYCYYYVEVKRWVKSYGIVKTYCLDYDDYMQIAMLGFYKVLDSYRFDQKASLKTFIKMAILRRLSSSLKMKRHNPSAFGLSSFSLDDTIKDSGTMRYDEVVDGKQNYFSPQQTLVIRETCAVYKKYIHKNISELEKRIIFYKAQGYKEKEIAKILDIPIKRVYNATYRYYRKMRSIDVSG